MYILGVNVTFYEHSFIILLREFGYYILRPLLPTHCTPAISIQGRHGINTDFSIEKIHILGMIVTSEGHFT